MRNIIRILAVVLVLSLLPVSALAEPLTATATIHEEIPFQVNPVYEGLVSPESFAPAETAPEEEGGLSQTQPTFNSPKATYVSPDEAAIILREQLKARSTAIDLYIVSDIADYQLMLDVILGVAMVHTGEPTEGDYLLWQFGGWGGGVDRQFENGYYYDHYVLDVMYYSTAEQEAELDAAIDQVLASLNLEGKSDYEKVCAIYDYICSHVTYDYEHLNDYTYLLQYSAYAALINGTAVCQGYANLLYRMLLEVGIDNRIITGETEEGAHAWNIVKLGDVYYNVDATWDSIIGDHTYFLRNSEGFLDHYRYLEYCTSMFHLVYPMSETDYVDGVAGVPEHIYVRGVCGEDAYWTIDWDGVLTIYGTGAMADHPAGELALWDYWDGDFDTIVIEEGITSVGKNAFADLDTLTTVDLPQSLVVIDESAFSGCERLGTVVFEEGLKGIGEHAFAGAGAMQSAHFPSSLETIGLGAFQYCNVLTDVQFSEGLKTISDYAFWNCNSIEEITIPSTVTYISGFTTCQNLKKVHINSTAGVIGMQAFYQCDVLENITIPEGITQIGQEAFSLCFGLTEITIPASVTLIEDSAFRYCRNLETIHLKNSGSIGQHAFLECWNTKNLIIEGEITSIGTYAFYNLPFLKEVTFPKSLKTLEYNAFAHCYELERISFQGDAPEIQKDVFLHANSIAYYPADNATWTEEVMQQYGGNITWLPDTEKVPEVPEGLLGDVSGDGYVDTYDAALIAMYDALLIDENGLDLTVADVSGDGFVDTYDAALIAMYDALLIDKFPAAS